MVTNVTEPQCLIRQCWQPVYFFYTYQTCNSFQHYVLRTFTMTNKSEYIVYVCYLRSCGPYWEKQCMRCRVYVCGIGSYSRPKGTVFPKREQPRPANNVVLFICSQDLHNFPFKLNTKHLKVHLTPKYFFRSNKSLHLCETHCTFLPLFKLNLDFLQAVKVMKSGHHLVHDRASFFCFSFNKRSSENALRKMCFFAYVIFQKGSKLQGENM